MSAGEVRSADERARQLMMAAMDGEASGEERAELERFLADDAALENEWKQLNQVKEATSAMAFRKPPDEVWSDYWTSVYSRLERGIGWILVSLGAITLLSYGAYHAVMALIADTGVPWFIKGAILAVAIGAVVLLVSVIREQLFVRRAEPYKDIER